MSKLNVEIVNTPEDPGLGPDDLDCGDVVVDGDGDIFLTLDSGWAVLELPSRDPQHAASVGEVLEWSHLTNPVRRVNRANLTVEVA